MYFVDTNILIYRFSKEDQRKAEIAKTLSQSQSMVISLQVINETAFNLLRKLKFTEEKIQKIIKHFCRLKLQPIKRRTLVRASELRLKHHFQYWDSLLLATALDAQCEIFYSEDLHNGMVLEGMTIVNPFESLNLREI